MTKITIDRTMVKQALEALENLYLTLSPESVLAISLNRRIAALRAALAQEQTEPVETFDEVWNAIDWDKWRKEPIRELVQMIHSKTSPRIAQGREPAQEPVARVELMTTGGSAGLATRIVEIDDHLRERLRPGQLLYAAPPQRKPIDVDALGIPHGQQLQPAQQQEPVVFWGVDWGSNGDLSCAVISRRTSDGNREILAVEYGPTIAPPQRQAEMELVAWNWMQDGVPFGPAYYGKPPDDDIARVAAKHGKTVRLLYAHPLT